MTQNIVGSTAGPFVNLSVVPDDGDDVDGAGLAVAAQSVMDNAAFHNADKLSKSLGGTMAAALVLDATTLPAGKTITLSGKMDRSAALPSTGGYSLEPDPVYMSDADATIDLATGGQRLIFLTAPAADRTITLRQAAHANLPPEGFWFEVTCMLAASAFKLLFKREGSGNYVIILGDGTNGGGSTNRICGGRVQIVAGVWRALQAWDGGQPGGGPVAVYGSDA